MKTTDVNYQEFVDEVFYKMSCINKFHARLEELTPDAKLKENIRIAFSNFLITYHQ